MLETLKQRVVSAVNALFGRRPVSTESEATRVRNRVPGLKSDMTLEKATTEFERRMSAWGAALQNAEAFMTDAVIAEMRERMETFRQTLDRATADFNGRDETDHFKWVSLRDITNQYDALGVNIDQCDSARRAVESMDGRIDEVASFLRKVRTNIEKEGVSRVVREHFESLEADLQGLSERIASRSNPKEFDYLGAWLQLADIEGGAETDRWLSKDEAANFRQKGRSRSGR